MLTVGHLIESSIHALAQSLNRYYSTKAASERFKTFNRSSIQQHAISLDGISKFFDPEEFENETEGESEYAFTQYVPVNINTAEELLSKKNEIEDALGDWLNCSNEISVTGIHGIDTRFSFFELHLESPFHYSYIPGQSQTHQSSSTTLKKRHKAQ